MTTVVFKGVTYSIDTPAEYDAYLAARAQQAHWTAWSDRGVLACFLSRWRGDPSRCRWCNTELTGRQRRWCSRTCSAEFDVNHFWDRASRCRFKTDGCQCVTCGVPTEEAFRAAIERGEYLHAKRYRRLEVHHRVPILGRHAEAGCHHHQDGLVTLCLWHHNLEHHPPKPVQLAFA